MAPAQLHLQASSSRSADGLDWCTDVLSDWCAALDHLGTHSLLATALHASIAMLCLRAHATAGLAPAPSRVWLLMALSLAALAVIEFTRMDLFANALMRWIAQEGGWYAHRRVLQGGVLLALGLATLVLLPRAWQHTRGRELEVRMAAFGLLIAAAVMALRLVSLHQTDAWLATRIANLSTGRLMQACGLALTGLAAQLSLSRHQPKAGPPHV